MPVPMEPIIPPTQCTPNVSRESSYSSQALSLVTAKKQITAAAAQTAMAPPTPTKPAAGVIATNPVTVPEQMPSSLAFPLTIHSTIVQVTPATATPNNVLKKARPAAPVASNAEPALKPNQPIHSMPVSDVACLGSSVSIRAVPVPHHVRNRQVGKGEPQNAEDDHRRELETFCKATADQRDCDCSKGQLEHAVHEVRQVLAFTKRRCHGRSRVFARHEQLVKRTDERRQHVALVARSERHAVTVDHPEHRDDAENREALHDGRQGVLSANHTCIEQGQAGDGHQQHERR